MKIGLLITGLIIGLVSCKPTDFIGRYELRHFPKTSLDLKKDGTFEFTQINPNPYLHPFDHPDEYYFTTFGHWTVNKGELVLNSSTDSLADRQPEIIHSREITEPIDYSNKGPSPEFLDASAFAFYDIFGDTVNILYLQSPDSNGYSLLHRTMKSADWPTAYCDTVDFHFYGYKPFTYIRTDKVRKEISVKLFPEYRAGLFKDVALRLTRRKIKKGGVTFMKKM